MNTVPFVDIHTHPIREENKTITVRNIFPGEGFAAFTGRNFYSVGLHPWHIGSPEENNAQLLVVEDALEFDHVIFVGECGLDKLCDTNYEEQKRVFEAQVVMAEENQYPLIIHCVKGYNDLIQIRKRMKPVMPWILHGYNGGLELTKQLVGLNFYFSFGENIFRNNRKVLDSFCYLPPDKLFFETDEYDGEVSEIFRQGAVLKDCSVENLKEAVWKNFNKIENSLVSGL